MTVVKKALTGKKRGAPSALQLWQTIKLFAIVVVGLLAWLLCALPLAVVVAWRGYRLRRAMRRHWGASTTVYVFGGIPVAGGVREVVEAWITLHSDRCVVIDSHIVPEPKLVAERLAWRALQLWGRDKIAQPVVLVVPSRGRIQRIWVHGLLRRPGDDVAAALAEALATHEPPHRSNPSRESTKGVAWSNDHFRDRGGN